MMEPSLPLSNIKVLDLTLARAGPTCVRHLADWGADVIRIEPPAKSGGDELLGYRNGPDYQNLHRNKRMMQLDLKAPEGHPASQSSENLAPVGMNRLSNCGNPLQFFGEALPGLERVVVGLQIEPQFGFAAA